jgi:plasmid replication initiation protein
MANLLKRKHPNLDLFICDVFDAPPKDLNHHLEHPFFTLSKRPDTKIKTYESPNGDYIKFIPSTLGLANIYDKDILIFVISQLMHSINNGETPNQTVAFSAYDLLIATNKGVSGKHYEMLKTSLNRLSGTQIETCFLVGKKEITKGFGLINSWEIIREDRAGRMEGLKVELSDWMYEGILNSEVLTLSRDYFLISSPLEKRLYELCRKHCGKQKGWQIGIDKLHLKSGSQSTVRRFKQSIKKICKDNNIPDYKVSLDDNLFIAQPKVKAKKKVQGIPASLKPQTINNAKKILNGRADVYALQAEYLEWAKDKEPPTKGYEAGFIGFCKKRMK